MSTTRGATMPATSRSPIGGQFKATKMWKDLVNHLYENANVKKRRILMKSHDDCFSGGNAVATLLNYVQANPNKFPNTSVVSRENIVRLCQSFIDANVFECVNAGDDSEKKSKFEDSSSRLYRFNAKTKHEFMRNHFGKSSQSLNLENESNVAHEVEHLPAKFSSMLTVPRSVEPATRHKAMFSPFGQSRKKSASSDRRTSSSQTSDSDCENQHPSTRKTPRLKRNGSLVGLVMKRSSSDSNLKKGSSTTSSSESDSSSKHRSPGDPLTRGRLRLSQRLSFRKKSLRRSGHSSYHLQQPCVIQNHAADQDAFQSEAGVLSKDLKRKSQRSVVPDNQCNKVQVVSSKPRQRKLTSQEISHVQRQSVRVRLLQILDLPFVETLIISPTFDKKVLGKSQTGNCQNHRHSSVQYSEVAASYNNEDKWIFNALTVLQHIPDSYNILRKHARLPDHKKKTALYFSIVNYYNSLQRPLIDENYNGIAQAIIALLASRPVDKIMEATQLFVHLLPDTRLTELRHLCMFLHIVCTHTDLKLVYKGNNQALVIENFTPAVIRLPESDSLENGLDGCKGLVRFIVQHHLRVFMLPASIKMILQRKVDLLEQGEVDSPSFIPDTTYCSLISEAEYQTQRVAYTRQQVQELCVSIQNSSLAPRKKKDLLKKLQRQHPEVFGANNNESERANAEVDREDSGHSLMQQTRSFLHLPRFKPERKLGSSESDRDVNSKKNSTSGEDVVRRRHIPTRSIRFTAPNSDPLSRKRRNSTRAEIYL